MVKNLVMYTILISTIALSAGLAQAACDANQAAEKMVKLSQGLDKRASEAKTPEESQKVVEAYEKINDSAVYYQKQDYTGVCNVYEKIAKEYNIQL